MNLIQWGDLPPYLAVGVIGVITGFAAGAILMWKDASEEIDRHERNAIIVKGQLDFHEISCKMYQKLWEGEKFHCQDLIYEIASLKQSNIQERLRRIEPIRKQPEYNIPNTEYKRRSVPWGRRRDIYIRDGYQCLRCGSKDQLTIDHIVPVVKGGTNDFDNLQTLCRSCNCQKQTKIADYRVEELVASPTTTGEKS